MNRGRGAHGGRSLRERLDGSQQKSMLLHGRRRCVRGANAHHGGQTP